MYAPIMLFGRSAAGRSVRSEFRRQRAALSTAQSRPPSVTVSIQYEQLVKDGKLKRDERQVALISMLDKLGELLPKYHDEKIKWQTEEARLVKLREERDAKVKAESYSPAESMSTIAPLSITKGGFKEDTQSKPAQDEFKPFPIQVPRGIYVHGNVGTGKTMLMDMFFDGLTVPKRRVHLHNFIQEIHREIHQEKKKSKKGANEIIHEIDIADAVILEAILDAMMREGLVLVATSNADPQDLHRRFATFLPRLLAHCKILDIESEVDYREAKLSAQEQTQSKRQFHLVTSDPIGEMRKQIAKQVNVLTSMPLPVGFGRSIEVPFVWHEGNKVVGCAPFSWLCGSAVTAFGPNEYQAICDRFDKFILADVPIIKVVPGKIGDESRRFGTFMDIAYEGGIELTTISRHDELFSVDETDAPNDEEEFPPEVIASIRSFLRARSRWRQMSHGI